MVEKAHTATKTQSSQKKKFFLKVNENPTPPLKKKRRKHGVVCHLMPPSLGLGLASHPTSLTLFLHL